MLARDNPFSTTKIERILRFDPALNGTTWEKLEARWLALGKRASLVGPHGAGKTTFLDSFAQRLERNGVATHRLFLNTETHRLSPKQWDALTHSVGKIVLLDGEEQLNFLQHRRFYQLTKHAAGVLVTRHSNGKLPTLLEFSPSIETLRHCVQALAPERLSSLEPHFQSWWEEHQGNIREMLLRCYDTLAKQ